MARKKTTVITTVTVKSKGSHHGPGSVLELEAEEAARLIGLDAARLPESPRTEEDPGAPEPKGAAGPADPATPDGGR